MNQDMVRKQKKYRRTWISFAVILFLLLLVFFSSINTGSLSVSFGQLLRGLFVEYDENVAAVYDLRFPRILISMLAGAAIAVSGVLFQAVLKKSAGRPGNYRNFKRSWICGSLCEHLFSDTLLFYTVCSLFWRGGSILSGLLSVLETGTQPASHHSDRCGSRCPFHRTFQYLQYDDRRSEDRCGIDRRSKYHAEDLVRCRNVISLCTGRTVSGDSVCRGMQSAVSGRQNGKRTWNQCKPHQDCDLPDGSFTCQRFNRSCRCRKLFGTDRPAYRQTAGWK